MMGRVIAVSNQKGGVGKTTTAISLASAMSRLGKKVLLVDMDYQANATQGLGRAKSTSENTVYDVLMKDVEARDVIESIGSPDIDLLPSNYQLAGADLELDRRGEGKEQVLRDVLDPVREDYDYVFIDCPPSLGILNTNALTAADSVLIPVQCEYYALEGLTHLLMTIRLTQRIFNSSLAIEGILMTMFDIRTRLSVEVSQEVRKMFGKMVYQNSIPRNVKLSEAPSRGVSIFEYDPSSKGAQAYMELAKEILKIREGGVK